jgi:hypothetical protein
MRLAAVKLARMWNVWPNEPAFRSWPARLIVAGTYLPVLLLAVFGAWRNRDRPWTLALCLAPAAYFTALHIVFVSSIRYRQPAMLLLIVLAAAGVHGRFGEKNSGSDTTPHRKRGGVPGTFSSLALRVNDC